MTEKFLPLINLVLCNRCGICITGCPENALKMTAQGPDFNQPVTCTYCTICEDLCPEGAIRTPLSVTWNSE